MLVLEGLVLFIIVDSKIPRNFSRFRTFSFVFLIIVLPRVLFVISRHRHKFQSSPINLRLDETVV